MKSWMFVATGAVLCLITGHDPARAEKGRTVTCSGILIEIDMNPQADFPMAVVYDNTDPSTRTCVLDLGHTGHWPLKGACWVGEKCVLNGPYFKKIGSTYYTREWDKAEAPDHPQ
jgi:hypothetical protein